MTELWIFIQQGCIKLIKSDSKNIYNFTKLKKKKKHVTLKTGVMAAENSALASQE